MNITLEELEGIVHRKEILHPDAMVRLADTATRSRGPRGAAIRPEDRRGLPGGLLYLNQDAQLGKPVIVVPDIHARMDFLHAVLSYTLKEGFSVFEGLKRDACLLICVGDGFHAEARARKRWMAAYDEYLGDFREHRAMDQEMRENLGLLEMILHLRINFPDNFFFLKGNHENIANEGKEGNYPFGKFVREGEMVTYWVTKFLGDEALRSIYLYEKSLPILAVCHDFIVIHAEPERFFPAEQVINCYLHPEVIYAFTWTDNDAAEEHSVRDTLEHFFPGKAHTRIFGGHRPIRGKYHTRAQGRYIQLHNPEEFILAVVRDMKDFSPEEDVHIL